MINTTNKSENDNDTVSLSVANSGNYKTILTNTPLRYIYVVHYSLIFIS